jgi:predicted Ser/Thr protein kinase
VAAIMSGSALPSEPPARSRPLAQGYQGAVYLVDAPGGAVIVKTASGRGVLRSARRAMLRREHAVYQRLRGVTGVPACKGLDRSGDLLLEFIEGASLREARLAPPERERFFQRLLEVIQAVHCAGVAHGDLKRKDNILVGPGNQPYLIDFGTAVACPPGSGLLRRALFRQLRRMDLNAWVKLKYQRQGLDADPADLGYYRPTLAERFARLVRRAWRTATFRRWRKSGG